MGRNHASQYANFGSLLYSVYKNRLTAEFCFHLHKILDNVTYNLASNYHTYI